jgi:alpha-ketoglutaric semialdehyde dehydrogenase
MAPQPAETHIFRAINAETGEAFGPALPVHGAAELGAACDAAERAFDVYRETTPAARADFLDRIGTEIAALGEALIVMAARETGLPKARIENERGRTIGQMHLFAELLRAAEWMRVRIDPALPDRLPQPRPDLRLAMVPLGPVAVFGASNFPLAFSTAGGDTASALAAGCPVVLKGHPAHPGTDALVAGAIHTARAACGMPEGVFGHVMGPGTSLGAALVRDPRIAAVAFTGSRRGGLALLRLAQEREVPVPVYAEMGSVNPVILLPAALRARGAGLGAAFVASLTLGAGQFCTNPGLLLAVEGKGLNTFIAAAAEALSGYAAATMLSRGILDTYQHGVDALAGHANVRWLGSGQPGGEYAKGQAVLFECAASDFLADPALAEEVFGPAALLVTARDVGELRRVVAGLEGQLTATLQMDEEDWGEAAGLLPMLERKAGRIIANGWPTGVEVTHAMMHGGPYPAASDSRSTSVGSLAIERFLRPVSYQNMPLSLLPPALRDVRREDG